MIGIVGGVGPYAGVDLLRKVFDNTIAGLDQDHLDTVLISMPGGILDRTEYLEGRVSVNPAYAIADVLRRLEDARANVAGIPCNTAHVDRIFNVVLEELQKTGNSIEVLHMIRETAAFIAGNHPDASRIGVLSTPGTYRSGAYRTALESDGYTVITPPETMQEELIHPAIYHPKYGVKACSNPIHPTAVENLNAGMSYLKSEGAEVVILGCTEIPLVYPGPEVMGIVAVDPTTVLARALIRKAAPQKLSALP